MRQKTFLTLLAFLLAAELAALLVFMSRGTDNPQNTVAINEAVRTVQRDWGTMENHTNPTTLDYVVLDAQGHVLFRTKPGLSETVNSAVLHRDTILDIHVQDQTAGKIIIRNDSAEILRRQKRTALTAMAAGILLQCAVGAGYTICLNRTIVKPFRRLKGFAERIAGGNLDIPLEMDRQNLFGAFTESFDIMRAELKRARIAEAKANAEKKELVANLSHDIKTPVASIKAAAEVGAALADAALPNAAPTDASQANAAPSARLKDNYAQIIRKADQINALVTNLFTAALEELAQLAVAPADMESGELAALLDSADYLHRAAIPPVPGCILYADRLRLQQVLDNIFCNSYKYAGTDITVAVRRDGGRLAVDIEDFGGGVGADELPLLKEKFRRGSNAKNIEGAGLGLYLADYFMKEMQGELLLENGRHGLKVTVAVALGDNPN